MAGPEIYLLIQRLLIVCLRTLPNMPTLRRLITRSKQMQLTLFSKSQFRIDVKTAVKGHLQNRERGDKKVNIVGSDGDCFFAASEGPLDG